MISRRKLALAPVLLALSATFYIATSVAAQDAPRVKFVTTAGDFVVEVYPDKAPKTVENFLQYVKSKHYDNTIFHRVIGHFMIQGGGFTPTFNQKPTRPPIVLEAQNGLRNETGTLAMARTNDPNSATAQFFINVKSNESLNAKGPADGYTVFGRVVEGMDVVNKIKAAPTGAGGPFQTDVPKTPIVITTATLVK
jgi:peptidyl-prolyl cis-trans isomerase A (cyclophilin A)